MSCVLSPSLQCVGVQTTYAQTPILQGIDLQACGGEFIAILGPNGSGKTTFLRVLCGVLPVTAGSVHINAHSLYSMKPRRRAQYVAVVPQKLEAVPHMTVRDFVLLGRYPHISWLGMYQEADYVAAEQAMQECDVTTFAARSLDALSGGELQRVLLARAFAQQSPILLLDEPSAALDVARMQELFSMLEKKRQEGVLIISVMHDINLAALYATRLVGVQQGRVLFDGLVSEVFTQEQMCALYKAPLHVFAHPSTGVPQACPEKIAFYKDRI